MPLKAHKTRIYHWVVVLVLGGLFYSFATDHGKPLQNGDTFPSLELRSKADSVYSILPDSASDSSLIMIEYWATWCAKCYHQHKDFNEVLTTYADSTFEQGKGIRRVAISLDKDIMQWKRLLAQIEFVNTTHFIDEKSWQGPSIVETGVGYLPYVFILDPQGKILSQGLTGEALRQKLGSWLKY